MYTVRLLREADAFGPALSDLDGSDITDPKNQTQTSTTQAEKPLDTTTDKPVDTDAAKAAEEAAKAKAAAESQQQQQQQATETKEETTTEPEGSIWDDVDKLRGKPLEVDFGEADPESPEGILIREKAVADEAIDGWEHYLKTTDPRGYAYLLHRQGGGSDDDFFARKTLTLPDYEAFKSNTDLHVRLYKESLVQKGVDEDQAQILVDKAVKDGKIFEYADKTYKNTQVAQEKELQLIEAENAEAAKRYTEAVNRLNAGLVSGVQEGKDLKFIIPDTEKAGFLGFVKERIQHDSATGKFMVVQELGEDNSRVLEALYLLYKKGDLSSIIKREAQSQNVRKFKRTLDKSKASENGAAEQTPERTGFVPLGSL